MNCENCGSECIQDRWGELHDRGGVMHLPARCRDVLKARVAELEAIVEETKNVDTKYLRQVRLDVLEGAARICLEVSDEWRRQGGVCQIGKQAADECAAKIAEFRKTFFATAFAGTEKK
jgi:hypothetical protein